MRRCTKTPAPPPPSPHHARDVPSGGASTNTQAPRGYRHIAERNTLQHPNEAGPPCWCVLGGGAADGSRSCVENPLSSTVEAESATLPLDPPPPLLPRARASPTPPERHPLQRLRGGRPSGNPKAPRACATRGGEGPKIEVKGNSADPA
ncbi:hypothetical protein KM043_004409 [Ampulex compressa]|nr:hypothetical protein KM043_004409 [Ampulex compressa]